MRPEEVRRAVTDACISHEWVSLGVSFPHHAQCEELGLLTHALRRRAVVLWK